MLAVLAAGMAFAADITGKWSGEFAGPDGSTTITFQFKQDGTKLTGTAEGPAGALPIQDGKVEGDKLYFVVNFDGGGGTMKIVHEGTIKDDEITLKVKMGDFEGGPPMKVKRVK
jgi:hypothetical protein